MKSQLRWGVLGTGNIVGKGGPGIQRSNNGIWLAVAGRNAENSTNAAEKYGVERAYEHYQELLDDPEIDAVYIALLTHLHYEWVMKAVQAGKHVLCEKPITMNAKEAHSIKIEAERHGVQVMEAFVWRSHPAHHAAKQIIQSGVIGDPTMFIGHFSFVAQQTSTRLIKEWGGGSLYDLGCYPLSWSRFMMDSEPLAVDCEMQFNHANEVETHMVGTLYFPEGRSAQISSSLDMASGSFYEVLGTKGRLLVEFKTSSTEMTVSVTAAGETKRWTTDRIEPFQMQAQSFADHILHHKRLPYGMDDAIANMKVIDALYRAASTQRRTIV